MTLRKTGIAVTMTATLGLAACVPQGEPMGERTQTGLIAGALGGAVLGAAVDDDDRGAARCSGRQPVRLLAGQSGRSWIGRPVTCAHRWPMIRS
ncbi:hypothetical protein QTA57_11795 [Fontisubflavum oceani]|uniref:hypothetical protein n=1 Tax=Fontisubflavum oceani TaxID=2978973 RepID=UPI0025B5DD13|nr:hypothetical protein [Fontisubflavum oceani]WJY20528.1 hypothetical protein QTA57_11795 [Fontisubflavum oceani]